MDKNRRALLLLVCIVVSAPAWGQIPRSQVVFGYVGLSTNTNRPPHQLKETDIQLVDNRIQGYLLEIARQENYSITNPKNSAQLSEYLKTNQNNQFREDLVSFGANLTVSGLIFFKLEATSDSSFRFDAFLYSSPNAELVAQHTENAPSFDSLLEKIQPSVYGLFGLQVPSATRKAQTSLTTVGVGSFARIQNIQLGDIVGSWRGDYGIIRVEIKPDGSGIAWLTETDAMRIRVMVSDQIVTVKQDEPNSPKIYLPVFPYSIASQVVRLARPMSWEFRLTQERDRLIGTKETSYFYIEQGKVVQVDNTYSRDALWARTP